MQPITLAKDTIDSGDIDSLIDWLKTYPRLTKGELTVAFEQAWAKAVGCDYAVFVNSGSSANLLAIYNLVESGLLRNNKVVVPAISWITSISPVIQFGLQPLLCDCNLRNLAVCPEELETLFRKHQPAAMVLVSVLGMVPDMERIAELCNAYDVFLVVDNCESLGSMYKDRHLENYGNVATNSSYFGHIISTIEGGMITTNSQVWYNKLKMLRSHGWDRDLSEQVQQSLRTKYGVNGFNGLYTFYSTGFNVRSTDLQAFLGLNQLKKLPSYVQARNRNYKRFNELIHNSYWKPQEDSDKFVSNMGYPVIHPEKNRLVKELKENNIEARPLVSGSMGCQPFFVKRYGVQNLNNANIVTDFGFYIPNHPYLTDEEIQRMVDIINKYDSAGNSRKEN